MNRARSFLIIPAVAILFAAGCGGGDGGSSSKSPASDPKLRDQAAAATEKAAAQALATVKDRNIPGPKDYKVVCIEPDSPFAKGVAPNEIKCHIEAFFKPYRGKVGGYIGSEDWLVPVTDGKLDTPVRGGEARIQAYLVADDKKNCTGRHEPDECTPPVPPTTPTDTGAPAP
jgi:hypothetical protein